MCASPRRTPAVEPAGDGISKGEQKVLDALASLEAVGVATPSKLQLSAFVGYSNPKSCGCFYCLSTFPPTEITEWIDEGQTALCPRCPVDSVIGSASSYPITREFLERMHDYWF